MGNPHSTPNVVMQSPGNGINNALLNLQNINNQGGQLNEINGGIHMGGLDNLMRINFQSLQNLGSIDNQYGEMNTINKGVNMDSGSVGDTINIKFQNLQNIDNKYGELN